MNKAQKYSFMGIVILAMIGFISRPLFYTFIISFLGVGITFLIYKKFKPNLRRIVLLSDSSLIFSFIGIPLILISFWFLVPPLLQFLFNLYSSYQITLIGDLITLVSKTLSDFPKFLIYILLVFATPLIFLKAICIINAFKLKKYFWLIFLVLFSPLEIIYYFLIGRKSLKNERKK